MVTKHWRTAICIAALLLGCGSDAVDDPRGHLVQITKVQFAPPNISCGARSFDYVFLIDVSMVNTTSDSVTLTGVSSAGTYQGSTTGKRGLDRVSLPFTPLFLRARDGANTTRVQIAGTCPPPADYGTIGVTLFMTTTRGQFATAPFNLSFVF